MPSITINITDDQLARLESNFNDVQMWLENFLFNRLRQIEDKAIDEQTEYQAKKISNEQRDNILSLLDFSKKEKI